MAKTKSCNAHEGALFQILLIALSLIISPWPVASQTETVHWDRVAQIKPDIKVLILVKGECPISLDDLAVMTDFGTTPADRDPALVLGLREAVFSVKLRNWRTKKMPGHLHGKVLDRFIMSGIYRIGFRVEKEGYQGPLKLEDTTPRDDFGKRLIQSEALVRPRGPTTMRNGTVTFVTFFMIILVKTINTSSWVLQKSGWFNISRRPSGNPTSGVFV